MYGGTYGAIRWGTYGSGNLEVRDCDVHGAISSRQDAGYLRVIDNRLYDYGAIDYSSPNGAPTPIALTVTGNTFSNNASVILSIDGLDGQGGTISLASNTFDVARVGVQVTRSKDLTVRDAAVLAHPTEATAGLVLSGNTNVVVEDMDFVDFPYGAFAQGFGATNTAVRNTNLCGGDFGFYVWNPASPTPAQAASGLLLDGLRISGSQVGIQAEGDYTSVVAQNIAFDAVPTAVVDNSVGGISLLNPSYSTSGQCDGFDPVAAGNDLATIINRMIGDLNSSKVPGRNGMTNKLQNILADALAAIADYTAGQLTTAQYVAELNAVLSNLDAFDNQLAAKISNGQLSAPYSTDVSADSALVRQILLDLIANA